MLLTASGEHFCCTVEAVEMELCCFTKFSGNSIKGFNFANPRLLKYQGVIFP